MADKDNTWQDGIKVSEMTDADALGKDDLIMTVQGRESKKATVDQINTYVGNNAVKSALEAKSVKVELLDNNVLSIELV